MASEPTDEMVEAAAISSPRVEPTPSDLNNLDAVVHALGIEDSDTTPAEAVKGLYVEIERLRASLGSREDERDEARRERDAMKEACAKVADVIGAETEIGRRTATEIAAAIRALPPPSSQAPAGAGDDTPTKLYDSDGNWVNRDAYLVAMAAVSSQKDGELLPDSNT